MLSTCSDYFEQMFERTNCKHPIIVLKDIRSQELEALLNYMYVGEVNVLQNELAGLIKAAECLMIKGLAVPDEAPSKEIKENKRTFVGTEDSPLSKRRKRDEETRPSPSQNQQIHREARDTTVNSQAQRQSSSASIPTPSPTVPRVPPNPISPSPSAGSASESVSEECSQAHSEVNDQPSLPNAQESAHRTAEPASSQSQQAVPEVILDEPGVKEEPQEIEEEITDTKEIFESHDFEHPAEGDSLSDKGPGTGGGPTAFEPQMLGSQPQSMEDLVAQAIPGSSGLQGNNVSLWEGEGSFPMEGFTGDASRPPQMDASQPCFAVTQVKGPRRQHECPHCHYIARDKTDLRGSVGREQQVVLPVRVLQLQYSKHQGYATPYSCTHRREAFRLPILFTPFCSQVQPNESHKNET